MPFQTVIVHWIPILKVQNFEKITFSNQFFYIKSWKFWLKTILQRSLNIISSVILAENAFIFCKLMSKLSFCIFSYIFRSFLRKIMYSMKKCGLQRAQVMGALPLLGLRSDRFTMVNVNVNFTPIVLFCNGIGFGQHVPCQKFVKILLLNITETQ